MSTNMALRNNDSKKKKKSDIPSKDMSSPPSSLSALSSSNSPSQPLFSSPNITLTTAKDEEEVMEYYAPTQQQVSLTFINNTDDASSKDGIGRGSNLRLGQQKEADAKGGWGTAAAPASLTTALASSDDKEKKKKKYEKEGNSKEDTGNILYCAEASNKAIVPPGPDDRITTTPKDSEAEMKVTDTPDIEGLKVHITQRSNRTRKKTKTSPITTTSTADIDAECCTCCNRTPPGSAKKKKTVTFALPELQEPKEPVVASDTPSTDDGKDGHNGKGDNKNEEKKKEKEKEEEKDAQEGENEEGSSSDSSTTTHWDSGCSCEPGSDSERSDSGDEEDGDEGTTEGEATAMLAPLRPPHPNCATNPASSTSFILHRRRPHSTSPLATGDRNAPIPTHDPERARLAEAALARHDADDRNFVLHMTGIMVILTLVIWGGGTAVILGVVYWSGEWPDEMGTGMRVDEALEG